VIHTPECLRGEVLTTRRYTNLRLPLPLQVTGQVHAELDGCGLMQSGFNSHAGKRKHILNTVIMLSFIVLQLVTCLNY